MKQWRFKPALQGDKPVEVKLTVPVHFAPPPEAPVGAEPSPPTTPVTALPTATPVTDGAAAPSRGARPDEGAAATQPTAPGEPTIVPKQAPLAPASPPDDASTSTTVRQKRTPPARATSDFVMKRDILAAVPKQNAGELLQSAPGVYVSRPEGEAVAQEIFLRGFDAEHGQDIELRVGAIPMNQPSHLHGQGYADLGVIVPEVVRSVRATEGVYDPRQGDFAVAGSVDFDLGVDDRGFQSKTSYGSFNTLRQLVLYAPVGQAAETFGVAAVKTSQGYGQDRGSIQGQALAQYAFELPFDVHALVHVGASVARASLAGVLRRDDVDAGRVDFYDAYPDPSAQSQSAFALRTQAGLTLERLADGNSKTALSLWASRSDFRLRENFTGYLERSRTRLELVGRGDLNEQEDHDTGFGAAALYRGPRLEPFEWLGVQGEAGVSLQGNLIDQAQHLLQAPDNETWDNRVDASLRAADLGMYLDAEVKLTEWVKLRGGGRLDVLGYDIDDRLGNFIPVVNRQAHILGFRRSAMGVALGPRATLEVTPLLDWLTLLASYGEGFRSPQARQLQEGENAPFAKVRSLELGVRLAPDHGKAFSFTTAAFATFLSTDLAFDPGSGSLERIGPTSRKGVVAHLVARPWTWAVLSASATYVNATLDEPPPATAENPVPAFKKGELLPYVPPLVVRADAAVHGDILDVQGLVGSALTDLGFPDLKLGALSGHIGLGSELLSPRPLPFGTFGDPLFLLEASVGARLSMVELSCELQNLLNSRYATSEYQFVSDWVTTSIPSLVPTRHFSAGPPFSFLASLTIHL